MSSTSDMYWSSPQPAVVSRDSYFYTAPELLVQQNQSLYEFNGSDVINVSCIGTQRPPEGLYDVSPAVVTLLSILYGTISVVTIVGNGLIILVIVTNRGMHTVTNFFIANLSIADVIMGFFSIPFQFQAWLIICYIFEFLSI